MMQVFNLNNNAITSILESLKWTRAHKDIQ